MSKCPFCEIANDPCVNHPYDQVEVFLKHSFVITPLNPVVRGHKLVIPVYHTVNAAEDPLLTGRVMRDAADYIGLYEVGDCNIITSIGSAATQTVPHFHVHIVPRRPDDGLVLPWTNQKPTDEHIAMERAQREGRA